MVPPPSPIIPLMVFSSSIFLFAFLPLFLAVYFLMPKRAAKNIVLLAFSLLFYAWGEPVYVWLMILSIAFNWAFGYVISRCRKATSKKLLLILDLALNIAILGF